MGIRMEKKFSDTLAVKQGCSTSKHSATKVDPQKSELRLPGSQHGSHTDILKPPNWTARKQTLKERFKQEETPNCTANIDYHLNELAQEMKAFREEGGFGLMIRKMKSNPNNARFFKSSKHKPQNKD